MLTVVGRNHCTRVKLQHHLIIAIVIFIGTLSAPEVLESYFIHFMYYLCQAIVNSVEKKNIQKVYSKLGPNKNILMISKNHLQAFKKS
jgi:hypothetical protein